MHVLSEQPAVLKAHLVGRAGDVQDGMAADLDAECARYEQQIIRCGGIDLQLLGIGRAGHLGFNEPLSALRSRTRVKALAPVTRAQNAPLFDHPDDMPHRAI